MRLRVGMLGLLSIAACGTSLQFIETARPPRPLHARKPEQVEVFMTGRPERPFKEVGIVESQQESEFSEDTPQEIVERMREFAAQSGCDALAIFSGNNDTVVSGGKDFTSSHTLLGYRGSCLVYTDAAAAPRRPREQACIPNSTQLCYGPGACRGAQHCSADGQSYTLCDCGQQTAQVPPAQ